MKSINIIVSNAAASKFAHLNSGEKHTLMDQVDSLIFAMPSPAPSIGLKIIAVLLLTPTLLFSAPQPSRVNAKLIEAVCQVESNGRATAIGDVHPETGKARALGAFQFWSATWTHTTQIRQRDGLPTTSYKEGSKDIKWSRLYAASYLSWIEKYIRDRGVKYPTAAQIYMCYNWGVGNARKVKFDVSKSPATTQRAIRKIEAWLAK